MEENNKEKGFWYKYPRPAVTTDCVVFGVEGTQVKVLLVERGHAPYKGRWAFPGGFLNMDESAEDGALRELREETGYAAAHAEQLYTFTNPGRDPRGRTISIAFFAIVPLRAVKGGDDAARAHWFSLDEVPPLAFDHDEVLQKALAVVRQKGLLHI